MRPLRPQPAVHLLTGSHGSPGEGPSLDHAEPQSPRPLWPATPRISAVTWAAGACLDGAVSSGELLRSVKARSHGGLEWPRGLRLSVLRGGSSRPRSPVDHPKLVRPR